MPERAFRMLWDEIEGSGVELWDLWRGTTRFGGFRV